MGRRQIAKVIVVTLAIFTTLVIVLSLIFVMPTYFSTQALRSDITQGRFDQSTHDDAKRSAASLHRLFSLLGAPGVNQLLSAVGLNFDAIHNELGALVAHSPTLAGANHPAKYLIAFQNLAEARGTGGLMGAYAVVVVDKGKWRVERTGSDASLHIFDQIPISMPSEYLQLYGMDPADWRNSNLSPHFAYAAQIWIALWKKQFGEQLDGVITLDPVAISYLLQATGPITLKSGEEVTSTNVVKKTLVDEYKIYSTDNAARKAYLVDIMNRTIKKIAEKKFSYRSLLSGVQKAILEHRLLLYSTNADVEKSLASTLLAGSLDTSAQNQYRAVVENVDGSKLDYYLKRSVEISSTSCSVPRKTQVRVSLTNTVGQGEKLPAYVLTRADIGKPADLFPGQHHFKLFIYGPKGSRLIDAYSPGHGVKAGKIATERMRPILVWDIDLPPGQSWTVMSNFAGGQGAITWYDQPLTFNSSVKIADRC
jgi:hypothetical protein